MRQTIAIFAACLLLGGFAAAGSSVLDGAEASASAGSSSSRAAFKVKVNGFCAKQRKRAQAKGGEIAAHPRKGESESEARKRLVEEAVRPSMEAEVHKLESLPAPARDRGKIKAIAAAIEKMVARARRNPQKFLDFMPRFEEGHDLARKYGIPNCGTVS